METRIYGLGETSGGDPTLSGAVQALARDLACMAEARLHHVVSRVGSDSVREGRQGETQPPCRATQVLQLYFSRAAAWQPEETFVLEVFERQLAQSGRLLFCLDANTVCPKAPTDDAANEFRRWMLLTRSASSQSEFATAWLGRHAALVSLLPGHESYLQHVVTRRRDAAARQMPYRELPVDGVAELGFRDADAMASAYASDARAALRDDGQQLLNDITTLLVRGERLFAAPVHPEGST